MQKSKLKVFLKFILIIGLLILINLTNGKTRSQTLVEGIFADIISFPTRLIVNAKAYFEGNNEYFANVELLKEENDKLKEDNEELKEKMLDYESLVAENDVLRKHLKLSNDYPNYDTVIADIVFASENDWEHVYTINKGENDGIAPGMTVIAENGLVGYIETTTANTAKIISILDAGNSVSARMTRTRDNVIVKGSSNLSSEKQMKLTNIPVGVSLVEGDRIETSGIGGIYPKGIVIGKVKSFTAKNNPIENEAIVESYVDFDKLETVAVIGIELEK